MSLKMGIIFQPSIGLRIEMHCLRLLFAVASTLRIVFGYCVLQIFCNSLCHAGPHAEVIVRRIDYGVSLECGDVALDDSDNRWHVSPVFPRRITFPVVGRLAR